MHSCSYHNRFAINPRNSDHSDDDDHMIIDNKSWSLPSKVSSCVVGRCFPVCSTVYVPGLVNEWFQNTGRRFSIITTRLVGTRLSELVCRLFVRFFASSFSINRCCCYSLLSMHN